MKLKYKFMLLSGINSFALLIVLITLFSIISINNRNKEIEKVTNDNVALLTQMVEHEFHHFISLVEVVSSSDLIESKLVESNDIYDLLSTTDRNTEIMDLNTTWMNTTDIEDPFIQDILQNELSLYLNSVQQTEDHLYGEIFVTNKYGVMIGSTKKLTTLAHADKYWWQGSYNDGDSVIFFDDRGYDDSVGEVVLGVVKSIYIDNEFIGVIKINIKVTGMLNEHIMHMNSIVDTGEFVISRPNGNIISKEGVTPLTEMLNESLINKMEEQESFVGKIKFSNSKNYYVGIKIVDMSEIEEESVLGGSSSSIDHEDGSSDGEWVAVYITKSTILDDTMRSTILYTSIIGLVLISGVLVLSYFEGVSFSNPIVKLQGYTTKLSEGIYDIDISTTAKGEIGDLYSDFDNLAHELKTSTTSIKNLKTEIDTRKKVETKLSIISQTDELTQIYNRRAFNTYFEKYLHMASRNDTQLGVVIFDLDDFKLVNDNYGHVFGDVVLVKIAEMVSARLRKSDIFARWGGEEFIFLTPNSSKEGLKYLAESVRKEIENLDFGEGRHITISMGCTLSYPKDTTDKLIVNADKAMYEAKQTGKNKVVLFE